MRGEIQDAVDAGILKPATSRRVTKNIEEELKQGLVFGDKNELLVDHDYIQLAYQSLLLILDLVSYKKGLHIQTISSFLQSIVFPKLLGLLHMCFDS